MKKIAILIFALICIFCLAACSGSGDAEEKSVAVYVDGVKKQTVYTDASHGYRILPPEKPEDVTTNPNSEKYFYGWFVDPNFQTPLLDSTKFTNGGAVYGKWITVYSNSFVYTVNYGKATIVGFLENAPTVLVIPAYINSFPVERIGVDAFKNATTVRTVILCDGIEEVGGFAGCNSIEKIEIPKSVTSIGASAFARCGFINFDIPAQITSIGTNAFASCTRLRSVNIPGSVKTIGSSAFANCDNLLQITLPSGVTSIGEHSFEGCASLISITIPDSVMSIGQGAFSGCNSLTKISIPFVGENKDGGGCQYFGHIFSQSSCNNSAINKAVPDSLKNTVVTDGVCIGDYAFSGCTGLTSITIQKGATSIGNSAFSGCTGLTSITIPNSITSIGYYAFSGCTSLTNITIPSSMTNIGPWAFSGSTGLTNITIPNSVTSIDDYAFYGCTSLTSINIPGSVKSVGSYAFYECTDLTSIAIPSGVTSIGKCAFSGCTSLANIIISNSVTSIGEGAFVGWTSSQTIYIQEGTVTAGWHPGWEYECSANIVQE